MRRMSNGEVGVDLEHVLFMPMKPLQKSLSLKLFPKLKPNKKSVYVVYICFFFCLFTKSKTTKIFSFFLVCFS